MNTVSAGASNDRNFFLKVAENNALRIFGEDKFSFFKKGCLLAILSLSLQTVYAGNQIKSVIPKTAQNKPSCSKINAMRKLPAYSKGSLEAKIIASTLDSDKYTNLDIDQDGIDDQVSGSCAQSNPPADSCTLSYQASTSSESIVFEFPIQDRFFLVKIDQRIYAISQNYKDQKKRFPKHKIFNLTPIGVKQICN